MKYFTASPTGALFHNLSALKATVFPAWMYFTPVPGCSCTSITYSLKPFFLILQFSPESCSETAVIFSLSLSFALLNKPNSSHHLLRDRLLIILLIASSSFKSKTEYCYFHFTVRKASLNCVQKWDTYLGGVEPQVFTSLSIFSKAKAPSLSGINIKTD